MNLFYSIIFLVTFRLVATAAEVKPANAGWPLVIEISDISGKTKKETHEVSESQENFDVLGFRCSVGGTSKKDLKAKKMVGDDIVKLGGRILSCGEKGSDFLVQRLIGCDANRKKSGADGDNAIMLHLYRPSSQDQAFVRLGCPER